MNDRAKGEGEMLSEAAAHLQLALEILDRAAAPAHIGAHIDLAAHQLHLELRRVMAGSVPPTGQSEQMLH